MKVTQVLGLLLTGYDTLHTHGKLTAPSTSFIPLLTTVPSISPFVFISHISIGIWSKKDLLNGLDLISKLGNESHALHDLRPDHMSLHGIVQSLSTTYLMLYLLSLSLYISVTLSFRLRVLNKPTWASG